jgi:23S rRNA (cytosine1962-C5)-methyltransferase
MKLVIIEEFQRALKDVEVELPLKDVWFQDRNLGRAAKFDRYALSGKKRTLKDQNVLLQEFGTTYKCKINANYDLGLYTDMAPFRKKIGTEFSEKKVLNLYSYTGAYSLHALRMGASEVVSVDLSQDYLNWLQENLELNPDLDKSKHQSLCLSVDKAIKQFEKQKSQFDWIICDPPSASSDGKKMSNALKNYEGLLPKMINLLNGEKGKIALFLNTHQVSPKKFRTDIEAILEQDQRGFSILSTFKNLEDGQSLPSFPEGHHLKGFVVGRVQKGSK